MNFETISMSRPDDCGIATAPRQTKATKMKACYS
jgi:hypothetical protein